MLDIYYKKYRPVFAGIQYEGNTAQRIRDRITRHRNKKRIIFVLSCCKHRAEHSVNFTECVAFIVLGQTALDIKLHDLESSWINKLRTGEPRGLNKVQPCALCMGIPLKHAHQYTFSPETYVDL